MDTWGTWMFVMCRPSRFNLYEIEWKLFYLDKHCPKRVRDERERKLGRNCSTVQFRYGTECGWRRAMQRRWLEAQHRHNLKGKKQNKIAKTSFNRKCIIIIFFFFSFLGLIVQILNIQRFNGTKPNQFGMYSANLHLRDAELVAFNIQMIHCIRSVKSSRSRTSLKSAISYRCPKEFA